MASVDERVAYLERRMDVHTAMVADLRADMRGLRTEMTALRTEVRVEIGAMRTDMRAETSELRSDIRRLDQKTDRHFTWLVGMLVGVLLALLGLAIQISRIQPL